MYALAKGLHMRIKGCTASAKNVAVAKGVHLGAIKKNNMKGKNFDLDKYYSRLRAPFERVFSQDNKRVRYVGIAKNQFAAFMNAICFNLKRMLVLLPQEKFAYKG